MGEGEVGDLQAALLYWEEMGVTMTSTAFDPRRDISLPISTSNELVGDMTCLRR